MHIKIEKTQTSNPVSKAHALQKIGACGRFGCFLIVTGKEHYLFSPNGLTKEEVAQKIDMAMEAQKNKRNRNALYDKTDPCLSLKKARPYPLMILLNIAPLP